MIEILIFLSGAAASSIIWYLILRNNRKRIKNWLNLPESIKKKYEEIEV